MRIIEEFWYGNIEPTEYDTSSYKEYKKLLELICRNEEQLKATKRKRINGKVPMQPHRHLILCVMQIYSSMTSNIILAPSLKPFWKIKQSVLV